MIICLCKNVSESKIKELHEQGKSKREIKKETGVAQQCGVCNCHFKDYLKELKKENSLYTQYDFPIIEV